MTIALKHLILSNTPSNCRFEYLDVNDGFASLGDSFDVIHMRAVGVWIQDQVRLVRDVARVLKPGGVLLWTGGDFDLYTEDYGKLPRVEEGKEGWCARHAILHQYQEATLQVEKRSITVSRTWLALDLSTSRKQGRKLHGINDFKTHLGDSEHFTYRGQEDAFCPIGVWKEDTPETAWKQVGALFALNMGRMLPILGNLLVQSGTDKETIDRWLATVKEEIETCNPKTQALFRHLWAVRTEVEWTPSAATLAEAA
ncbi:hypothetical protein FS837_000579 [Tulasnella sp. UAMH 9824]|nr:hypothetical protein FS837_000579 [Tulasnella sp. UAMH 9824]